MKSFFEEDAYSEVTSRIHQLTENASAQWGKMSVGQMVWHCQGPFNIMLEKNDYGMKPNWLVKVFFKKSLYNDKPWRKNLPTAKFLKPAEDKNLDEERKQLIALIDEAYLHREKDSWKPHPGFGYFTKQQWGQMQYKHLDHHLRQFGV